MKGFLTLMVVIAALASAYGVTTVIRSPLLSTREGKIAARLVFVGIAMSWGALLAIYAVLSLAG